MQPASYVACLIAASLSVVLASGCDLSGRQHIGVMLGDPTGVSYRADMDERTAIAVGVGLGFANGDAFHGHVDYIRIVGSVADVDVDVYVGVGARFRVRSDDKPGNDKRDDTDLGPRVPVGLNYEIPGSGWHLFGEIAPGVDLINPKVTVDFAVGARVVF